MGKWDEKRIAELRGLCDKATAGPWKATHCEYGCSVAGNCPLGKDEVDNACMDCDDVEIYSGAMVHQIKSVEWGDYTDMNDEDADFVVASRTALPEALDEIERLQAEVERLNELKLVDLHTTGDSMNMSVEGLPAKTFMAALVAMFEAAKAKNYLTITADYKEHHYGITIQKADGKLTPQEQIASMVAKLSAANARADAAGEKHV